MSGGALSRKSSVNTSRLIVTDWPDLDNYRVADYTADNLRGWTAAFPGSVKAITESLGYSLISDSLVNRIRRRVAQVRVENAPIPTVAKMFRQRMNAGCRVAVLSLLGWRIDPRQANYALRRFAADCHRSCLAVLIPQPDLSSGQRPVYATLGVVCRLPNFILKCTGPENHQTAISRTCLA
jgi:hypothetical protein